MKTRSKENKKVRNATPNVYNGIEFKSILEKSIYKNLLEAGITPEYESETFTIWRGFKPEVPFYDRQKIRGVKMWKNTLNKKTLQDMTYTPDFIFKYHDIKIIIEAKGNENEQFPIKKKLFRAYLETCDYPVIYAEIFTVRQLKEFLEELRSKY